MKINYELIDPNMRYIVKTLNEKGWNTLGSCEGHWNEYYNRYVGAYLEFEKAIEDKYKPKINNYEYVEFIKLPNQLKKVNPFYYEEERTISWNGSKSKKMSREDKDKEHNEFINKLIEWVNKLPRVTI